jgi:hypothetical protein
MDPIGMSAFIFSSRPGTTPPGKCEFTSSLADGGNFMIPVWRSMYDAVQPGEPIDPLPD